MGICAHEAAPQGSSASSSPEITFHSAQPGQCYSPLLTLTVWMQDKNGLGDAMGRQDLALLHFTKCPAETFVSRAFVSLPPRPLESVPSEQTTTAGGLLSHLPGPWMMEGLALFLAVSCMWPLALFSAFACRNMTSLYLEPGPQRIGSKYKKVMFVEYEDGTFRKRKVSSQQDKGILGPVIKGEVGDQFKVREIQLSTVETSGLDAVPTNSSWLVAKV